MKKIIQLLTIFLLITSCEEEIKSLTASFISDKSGGIINDVITFYAMGKEPEYYYEDDYYNDKYQIRWDWDGDGNWDTEFSNNMKTYHKFTSEGEFEVTMEVHSDESNLNAKTTKTIKIYSSIDSWEKIADFPGYGRNHLISFEINNIAYVGLGTSDGNSYQDLYGYNSNTNTWREAAWYPGNAGEGAVAFAIDGYGYVGTGDYTKEFYKFKPDETGYGYGEWTKIADFPGYNRSFAFAFATNGKAYVGGGIDKYGYIFNDFWEYNPSEDKWTQLPDLEFGERTNAISFVINNKGYVVGGKNFYNFSNQNESCYDLWEYDPSTNNWIEKELFPFYKLHFSLNDILYQGSLEAGFAIGNKGYVYCFIPYFNFYEYDPQTNLWTEKKSLNSYRKNAITLSINNRGYIGLGKKFISDGIYNELSDFYVYTP